MISGGEFVELWCGYGGGVMISGLARMITKEQHEELSPLYEAMCDSCVPTMSSEILIITFEMGHK